MAEAGHDTLRRIAGLAQERRAAEPTIAPGRVLRRAATRAGDAVGLPVTSASAEDRTLSLDIALAELDPRRIHLGLEKAGMARGLATIDLDLRDALVEVQTLGRLPPARSRGEAGPRPVTAADTVLVLPFLTRLLAELAEAPPAIDLALWTAECAPGRRFAESRTIAASLPAGTYREVRLTLDLGTEGRAGTITLLLPPAGVEAEAAPPDPSLWQDALRETVYEAPATLTAVLARLRVPLAVAGSLKVGQVLPLPGVTVGSVRVESAPGQFVAPARLGQVAGLRAIRLELPLTPELGSAFGQRGGTAWARATTPLGISGLTDTILEGGGSSRPFEPPPAATGEKAWPPGQQGITEEPSGAVAEIAPRSASAGTSDVAPAGAVHSGPELRHRAFLQEDQPGPMASAQDATMPAEATIVGSGEESAVASSGTLDEPATLAPFSGEVGEEMQDGFAAGVAGDFDPMDLEVEDDDENV